MKKLLAVLAIAAAVLVGPGLLDLYRLQHYIETSAQAADAAGGPWPRLADACVACHGGNGSSLNQHYPSLAGQPATYLAAQLRDFASGQRVFPIMNAMARSLNDREIGQVAEHFARQRPQEDVFFEPNAELQQKGAQIVASGGCAVCHGDGLLGRAQFPRLAGEGYDYLSRQLNAFADGTRRDPTNTMNALASAWTPEQRIAIAAFLASRKPAP